MSHLLLHIFYFFYLIMFYHPHKQHQCDPPIIPPMCAYKTLRRNTAFGIVKMDKDLVPRREWQREHENNWVQMEHFSTFIWLQLLICDSNELYFLITQTKNRDMIIKQKICTMYSIVYTSIMDSFLKEREKLR